MPPSGFASVSIRSSAKVISGNIGSIFSPGSRAFKPAVEACRIVPAELPGTAGVVGAVAAFKMETTGRL